MIIPEFPQFTDLDMSSKDVIRNYLSAHPLDASEYTYTNMFAFRETYNFKISLLKGNLIILKNHEPVSAFCPVGALENKEVLDQIFDYLERHSTEPCIERVPESFVSTHLEGNDKYTAVEDRDSFDYIYEVKKLAELKGRKFHDKKNKVNKFRRQYEYEYLTLTPELIRECIEFEDYWCEVKECEKYYGLEKERQAILEMLNNFETLKIKGGVIKIDDKIVALTLGEKYLPDTIVIHVEKAGHEISGLYQVINQEFLAHEAGDCEYVNREQDLGIEGLRRAKMSYHPVKFIKKFKVRKRWRGV
jgi:hypothetical protein